MAKTAVKNTSYEVAVKNTYVGNGDDSPTTDFDNVGRILDRTSELLERVNQTVEYLLGPADGEIELPELPVEYSGKLKSVMQKALTIEAQINLTYDALNRIYRTV